MKRSPTFYIKTALAILGTLALVLSATMPILKEKTYSYSGPVHVRYISAVAHPLWYCIFLAAGIVFALGYFFNRTVNVVLVFVFAPLFTIGIGIATFLSTFSLHFFGPSVEKEVSDGYTLAVIGYLLVSIATCISVLRKKTHSKKQKTDLLDEL